MKTRTKTFDAVEVKHRAQKAFQAKIAGMTREQELAFYVAIEQKSSQTRSAKS